MNNCFFLVILITLTFLVAFFTMFRSFWTIYHQTKHTVRHLGGKHNVKWFFSRFNLSINLVFAFSFVSYSL